MCTYVHVLYCVLFYWYLLCSRKANFYVIHRQQRSWILYSVKKRKWKWNIICRVKRWKLCQFKKKKRRQSDLFAENLWVHYSLLAGSFGLLSHDSVVMSLWVGILMALLSTSVMVMVKWCLTSSDVSWHIRDKLRPMPKHGSVNLYVHGNQKARWDGQLRTATSTLAQLLNYAIFCEVILSEEGDGVLFIFRC